MDIVYPTANTLDTEQRKEVVNENSCTNVTSVLASQYVSFSNACDPLQELKTLRKKYPHPIHHHRLRRPHTYGVLVKHLRKLARMGGGEYLGELAYNRMACEICKIANDDENMILCDRCNGGFHIYCLKPSLPSIPCDDWYCSQCREIIDQDSKARKQKIERIRRHPHQYQSTIFEFFHAKPEPTNHKRTFESISKNRPIRKCRMDYQEKINEKPKKSTNSNSLFHCYQPSSNTQTIQKQLLSLLTSMMNQNIEFTNTLIYPSHIPKSMNSKAIDNTHCREMTKQEREEYHKYKSYWSQGLCTPVLVKEDPIQGYVVYADEDIPKNTLICEYCGVLETVENCEHCDNDSIMDLVYTKDDKTSLVIIPDKQGNLARYFSGINNYTKDGKKKQNVYSCRIALNNEIHLLLITKRDIKKGEMLAYDYNGYKKQYPTEHFI